MSSPANSASFEEPLLRRDVGLFDGVPSATSVADRQALLFLQSAVRRDGDYVYLEIGSYLGGTLQPYCADASCRCIYSIDKRTPVVADVRGVAFAYANNTSVQMLEGLRRKFADGVDKVVVFDCDAREIPAKGIGHTPQLCFIDGEHTLAAVRNDFAFCRQVASPDAIIGFHDANLIFQALAECGRVLRGQGVPYRGIKLSGSVYAILLGEAIRRHGPFLAAEAENEAWFRIKSTLLLPWERVFPHVQPIWLKMVWTAVGWRSRLRRWIQGRG